MSGDWKPGTVAKATVRGVPDVTVFAFVAGTWVSGEDVEGTRVHGALRVTDVRPLVVLDIEDAGLSGSYDVRRINLLEHLRKGTNVAQHLADLIEAQTKPPRIPEPGLWGVVEAPTQRGGYVWQWVHHPKDVWLNAEGDSCPWAKLVDPVLVRDGVTE
jgi:hypothetical protein